MKRFDLVDFANGLLAAQARPAAKGWTQHDAIALCREVEAVCPEFGCHVALTGGCLYKDGERKDLDLLFYRIRSFESVDIAGLFGALANLGIRRITDAEVWCIKACHEGRGIDCFFPETEGDYTPGATAVVVTETDDGKLEVKF